MRSALLACVVAWAALAAGCYESLTDIATPDKLVFYDDLVGTYQAVHPAAGRVVIEKGKDKSYRYRQYDAKDALVHRGGLWVIKLGEEHFYQISVDGYATGDGKPVYALGRLRVEGEAGARVLTGYAFKSPDTLFGDPTVTSVEYEREEGGERRKHRAVSMPPEKLHAYLALRAAEMTEPTLKFRQTAPAR